MSAQKEDSQFTRHSVMNGLGEIGSRFPLLAAEILAARVLGPAVYGLWATVQLMVNYNNFTQFGFISALAREEPRLLAAGKFRQLSLFRNVVFSSCMLLSIIVIVACLFILRSLDIYDSGNKNEEIIFYISISLIFFFQQIYIFWQTSLQNKLEFKLLSAGKILYSVVFALFIFLTIRQFGLLGCLVAWVIGYAAALIFYHFSRTELIPKLFLNAKIALYLFRLGFPIFLAGMLRLGLSTLDKWFVLATLGKTWFGYYNVTAAFLLLTVTLSGVLSRVFSPLLMRMISKETSKKDLLENSLTRTDQCSTFISLLTGLLAISVQPFIWFVVPDYAEGNISGFILIFAGHFMGIVQFLTAHFVAVKQQMRLLVLTAGALIFLASAVALVLAIGYQSIEIYALLSCLSWLALTGFLTVDMHRDALGSLAGVSVSLKKVFSSVSLVILISCAIFLSQNYVDDPSTLDKIIACALSYLIYTLFILYLSYSYGPLSEMRVAAKDMVKKVTSSSR